MKEIIILNPESASTEECQSFAVREAARAVVLDTDGKIALLHVSSKNYYKLPGVDSRLVRTTLHVLIENVRRR